MSRTETLLSVFLAFALVALFLVAVCGCAERDTPTTPVDVAEQALEAAEDTSAARRAGHIADADRDRAEADRLAEVTRLLAEQNAALVAALDDLPALRAALAEPVRALPPDAVADSVSATCRARGACR